MMLKSLLLATAMLTAAAIPSMAQVTTVPKPAVPAPRADRGMITQPQHGVVRPPNTDPGIAVPPPHNGTATVIPPPGTPGNNPTLVPK
jgi:hypothetical protein